MSTTTASDTSASEETKALEPQLKSTIESPADLLDSQCLLAEMPIHAAAALLVEVKRRSDHNFFRKRWYRMTPPYHIDSIGREWRITYLPEKRAVKVTCQTSSSLAASKRIRINELQSKSGAAMQKSEELRTVAKGIEGDLAKMESYGDTTSDVVRHLRGARLKRYKEAKYYQTLSEQLEAEWKSLEGECNVRSIGSVEIPLDEIEFKIRRKVCPS